MEAHLDFNNSNNTSSLFTQQYVNIEWTEPENFRKFYICYLLCTLNKRLGLLANKFFSNVIYICIYTYINNSL